MSYIYKKFRRETGMHVFGFSFLISSKLRTRNKTILFYLTTPKYADTIHFSLKEIPLPLFPFNLIDPPSTILAWVVVASLEYSIVICTSPDFRHFSSPHRTILFRSFGSFVGDDWNDVEWSGLGIFSREGESSPDALFRQSGRGR